MQQPLAAASETDALIIGAGPAGLFQAFQLGLLGLRCQLVDALPYAGGQCVALYADKALYDLPGLPVTSGRALVDGLLQQIAPFAPPLHLGQQVSQLTRLDDGRLHLTTSAGQQFFTRSLVIAAGMGAFVPRRLALPEAAQLEGTRLFYHPSSAQDFAGQRVVVFGGDDSAVATAIALAAHARRVTLVHRRQTLQAEPALLAQWQQLLGSGQIDFVVGQPCALVSEQLHLTGPDGQAQTLVADSLVACLGLSPRLGPIKGWGLALEQQQLSVDTETLQTSEPGIFAVGDIASYPGKKKLLVCAFHEATLAAWGIWGHLFPGQARPLQYTTSSSHLHQLLAVPNPDQPCNTKTIP